MATTIDWGTKVISVPQADLTLVSGDLYEMDTAAFRLDLKDLEDSDEGMPFPDTHIHNVPVTVAGVTYARTIEIINGYSITLEDTGSPYTVRLVGSNNNIFDVENGILNPTDGVTVVATNSAGYIQIETGVSGLTASESAALLSLDTNVDIIERIMRNKRILSAVTGTETLYEDDSSTPSLTRQVYEDESGSQTYRGRGHERVERFE